jgi:hypothetical protein
VLFGSVMAYLTGAIDVQSLPYRFEFCFGRHSFDYFSSSVSVQILNVAALQADQVYVRLHVRIESCLALWKIQFLYQAVFRQDLKGLVDRGKTDCRMHFPDFTVNSLCGRMISAMEGKSADCYPLGSGLVSVLSESFDYHCV